MKIEEEIKILENALSGALLVPSECAFVSTEIIKICLDTLKTYESWEDLIRFELEKQIRADAEREFQNSDYWNDYLAKVIADAKADERAKVLDLIDRHLWNYSQEVWEDFQSVLEQLKEQKK